MALIDLATPRSLPLEPVTRAGEGDGATTTVDPNVTNSSLPITTSFTEDTTMADTVAFPTSGGLFGGTGEGGLIGGLILGSLLRNNGGFLGGDGGAAGAYAASHNNETSQILQAMNQQQLASATQILTQDVNRAGHDVATSAAATQATVAAGNLQNTISTLQGQTALTKDIMDSTITNAAGHTGILGAVAASSNDTNAAINNARSGISADINASNRAIDADLHAIENALSSAIAQTRDDINRAHYDIIGATHANEISNLRSAFDTQRAVYETANLTQKSIADDGDKTRSLISNINIADLNRQIAVTEAKLAEALGDRRHLQSTHDIIINNNNNNTAVATAIAQQAQQQQIANIASGLATLTGHTQNMTQLLLNTGSGNIGAVGVQS